MSTPWDQIEFPQFPQLTGRSRCDVAVIGGGISGLSAAYFLKRAGKEVCLLERGRLGHGDTGCTTAHLAYVTDQRLSRLVDKFGEERAWLTWHAGAAAIDAVESVVREQAIDCNFQRVPGYLHASLHGARDERDELMREAELASRLGFDGEFVDAVPGVGMQGIRFDDQGRFHPLAYLAALARAVDGGGSRIAENSEVVEIESDPLIVKTETASVKCDYVVIATHVPLMGVSGMMNAALFQSKLAGYMSYAVGAYVERRALPEALYWDTSDPYHYLRVDRGSESDYAIFGGCDHKTGQTPDTAGRWDDLAQLLRQLVPGAAPAHRWSGQIIETNDGLPYIGETARRQFVATGFAGNGMTFGTLAGIMACDAVLMRPNPWQELFDPGRKKLRGGTWSYLKENVDYPYYLLKDRLTRSDGTSTSDVKRGEGKILKLDGKRVATSRDEQGELHQVSAVCPHMGCLVRWNKAEQTWDCPCHGSRFRPDGEVLAGPAESPLPPTTKSPPVEAQPSHSPT